MIIRSLRALSQPLFRNRINVKSIQPARNEWLYRQPLGTPPRWEVIAADGMNCLMWWWIFVHCFYQYGHIIGEYDYPEPEKWKDAELGVVDVD